MHDNQARDLVRASLEAYLQGKGINTRKPFRCLRPEHPDHNPSMHYDPNRQKVHCFSCGADLDMFDLIGIEFGLTETRDIFRKAFEYFGIEDGGTTTHQPAPTALPPEEDQSAYYARTQPALADSPIALAYLARRGISLETAQRFGLGFDPAWRSPTALRQGKNPPASPRLIIPTSEMSYVARAIDDSVEPKYAKMKEGRARPLNMDALGTPGPVFVVEGEMDALAIAEAGQAAVSIGSVASAGTFLSLLDLERPKATLLLCLDDDEAGRRGQEKLTDGLSARGFAFYTPDILLGCNDPNEALQTDREAFVEAVQRAAARDDAAAMRYMQNSAAFHVEEFLDGIKASVDTPAIPTGFDGLDEALDGGLYEGLYIVGAITSLGKTTFALQMGDQIAESGTDVLIFSLEMARHELMAKSMSRLTFRHCLREGIPTGVAKTARGITAGKRYARYSDEERGVIRAAVGAYEEYAGCVYIHEGMGDIGVSEVRRVVEQHVALLERRPVVIIDYLQILAPHMERGTDKQNTDKAVLELKRLSRDFKIPVVGISSFNRAGYATKVQMESFKESGAIEYSSDVLLGLQCKGVGGSGFDPEEAKRRDPREIELLVLKNRNGKTGVSVEFKYYPMFNFFDEAPLGWKRI